MTPEVHGTLFAMSSVDRLRQWLLSKTPSKKPPEPPVATAPGAGDAAGWSIQARLRDFKPHASWRPMFAPAYERIQAPVSVDDEVAAWRQIAMIFGDMGACEACLLVCLHGRAINPSKASGFQAHMNLCYLDMGLADPSTPGPSYYMMEIANMSGHADPIERWFARELQQFGGSPRIAAEFCLRLAAIRLGILGGPPAPRFPQLLDPPLWQKGARSDDT